jgi:hypothetical protein
MLPLRIVICSLLLLLGVAGCKPLASMTQEQFQKLVDAPGDDVPMVPLIANGSPHWNNSSVSMLMKYPDGKVYSEEFHATSKTIGGKNIVYSAKSKLNDQEMHSVLVADEKSGTLKVYALYGDKLVGSDLVYDAKAKTYTEKASYGDGFVETTTGHWSDTEDDSHSEVYQHGALVMSRDMTNRPVVLPK